MNSLAATLVLAAILSGAGGVNPPVASPARSEPAGRPLDPRIKPGAITELAPPPLPTAIDQPLPPVHRIAPTHRESAGLSEEQFARARAAIDRGLQFLSTTQAPSGAWLEKAAASPSNEPARPEPVTVAVTAMGMKAFAQAQRPRAEDHAVGASNAGAESLARALEFVLTARDADGLWGGETMSNYVHAAVVSGLASVGETRAIDSMRLAVEQLKTTQWDDGEGLDVRKDWYGGSGYGKNGRPDLSNTQMMLDALHDAGVSPDDPAVQRAICFIARTQNLKSTNDAAWAQQGSNDGGFVYTPANGGESMASEVAGEGRRGELLAEGTPRSLRSYGSMTYAGFKSLLYAGLARDDVRVRAAFDWLRRNFTFDENPGMGQQGLFYYYHAMSRCLLAAQQSAISPLSADGTEQPAMPWREALIDALVKRQHDDGSWKNEQPRWMESEPEMATIYAVLALEECLKPG